MEGNKLYVGNLYLRVTKEQLRDLCSRFGQVQHVDLIEGSGYAYVEMSSHDEVEQAVKALDGVEFRERVLRVK